jgi:hypothetical protein
VRPLSADERERALGFPPLSSSSLVSADVDTFSSNEFHRCAALGNAFSVTVLTVVASHLAEICQGAPPGLLPGAPEALTAAAALTSLGARSTVPLNASRRGTPPTSAEP